MRCQHSLCRLLQLGALTCLLAGSACARCSDGHGDELDGPCRHLTDAHDHEDHGDGGHGKHEDHVHLTEEVPADDLPAMVQDLYRDSDSSSDLVGWMLQAFGEGCADIALKGGAAEGSHEGHDHRRRLLSADAHDDHDHDHDGDHDHDEHSGDEHSGEGETVIDALALREDLPSGNQAVRITEALMYLAACTINGGCTVEVPGAEQEEAGSDDLLGLKFGLAAAIFAMTVITSYLPALFMRSRHYQGILCCLNCFSGSVFLTVGLTHMLPDTFHAQESAYPGMDYPLNTALVVIGFLLILFVEQVVFKVHGGGTATAAAADDEGSGPGGDGVRTGLLGKSLSVAQKFRQPLLTELALVVHAVLAAIVLGLAKDRARLMTIFAAIVSHKIPAAMSIATRFLYRGVGLFQMFILLLPFHVLPPVAIMIATAVGGESDAASLILGGLATGTFLYIGAFEVVAEEFAGGGCGHGGDGAGAGDSHTAAHSAHGAPDGDKYGDDTGPVGVVSGESKEGKARGGWYPGPYVKFLFYCSGTALLLGVTVALPAHEH